MTASENLRVTDEGLGNDAWKAITASLKWIMGEPRSVGYKDMYTSSLQKKPGLMSRCEGLALFLRVRRFNRQNSAIQFPTLDDARLIRDIDDTLAEYRNSGFDGRPYFSLGPESTKSVSFTDSASFLALTLHQVAQAHKEGAFTIPRDRENLLEEVHEKYVECVQWLVENQISWKGAAGWGWTAPKDASALGKECPPQNYFTCSAFISILEAVTSHGELLNAPGLRRKCLEALRDARLLLLSPGVFYAQPGWFDFAFERGSGFVPDTKNASAFFSTYPIEALSYLYLCAEELRTASAAWQGDEKTLADELTAIAGLQDLKTKLRKGAEFVMGQIETEGQMYGACEEVVQHKLPFPGERQSSYDDGATPYNFVNALNLWARVDPESAKGWKELEPIFIRRILDSAWVPESGFRHFMRKEAEPDGAASDATPERTVAIYATRAAVDMLLGINFKWPDVRAGVMLTPTDLAQIQGSIEGLRSELRQAVGFGPGVAAAEDLSELRRDMRQLIEAMNKGGQVFGGDQIEGFLRETVEPLLETGLLLSQWRETVTLGLGDANKSLRNRFRAGSNPRPDQIGQAQTANGERLTRCVSTLLRESDAKRFVATIEAFLSQGYDLLTFTDALLKGCHSIDPAGIQNPVERITRIHRLLNEQYRKVKEDVHGGDG